MQNNWREFWGRPYDRTTKQEVMENILPDLELNAENDTPSVLLDIGCGALPISNMLSFEYNCKTIKIDIAIENSHFHNDLSDEIKINADIEKFNDTLFETKKKLLHICKFLDIAPQEDTKEQIDIAIFSEILNYIDYKKVLKDSSAYIKKGGKIVIINMPGRGFRTLFSEKGVCDNLELYSFLEEIGFEIGKKYFPWNSYSECPDKEDGTEFVTLVARKKTD